MTSHANRHSGFSLIEIAVVLIILTVLLGGIGTAFSSRIKTARIDNTKTKLAQIETALIQFVTQSGRLPCPADGRIASGAANAGLEMSPCGTQDHGVVPWIALGLSEADSTDEWGTRFTYRVGGTLITAGAMNMSKCDPAAPLAVPAPPTYTATATCNTACTSATLTTACTAPADFLFGKGLNIENGAGTVLMNKDAAHPAVPQGAAFVVLSHGPSAGGGYTTSGQLRTTTSGTDGTREQFNYANLSLRTSYTDESFAEVAGTDHFDDFVIRPSILSVISRAGLQPRSQP